MLPKLTYNHLKLCCHHRYAFHYRLNHDCHISPYITCHMSRNSTQIPVSTEDLPTSSLLHAFCRPPATLPVTLEVLNSIDQENIHKGLLNTALNVCSVLCKGKTTTTCLRHLHFKNMLPAPLKPALMILSNPMALVGLITITLSTAGRNSRYK